jgi:hypothetical protein
VTGASFPAQSWVLTHFTSPVIRSLLAQNQHLRYNQITKHAVRTKLFWQLCPVHPDIGEGVKLTPETA